MGAGPTVAQSARQATERNPVTPHVAGAGIDWVPAREIRHSDEYAVASAAGPVVADDPRHPPLVDPDRRQGPGSVGDDLQVIADQPYQLGAMPRP